MTWIALELVIHFAVWATAFGGAVVAIHWWIKHDTRRWVVFGLFVHFFSLGVHQLYWWLTKRANLLGLDSHAALYEVRETAMAMELVMILSIICILQPYLASRLGGYWWVGGSVLLGLLGTIGSLTVAGQ
jgi:hypothetical protein